MGWHRPHVMDRGAGRRAVFTSDEQRQDFLSFLADAYNRFHAEWPAYCLMDTHDHLLIRTPEANLQRIMRQMNGLSTQCYNRTEGRDGPLFRGRDKTILVEPQVCWTQLSRSIQRNPLEARLMKRLDQYRWSSDSAFLGTDKRPPWITCKDILTSPASDRTVEASQAFVAEDRDREIQKVYSKKKPSPVLGSDAFKHTLKLRSKDIDVSELRHARVKPTVGRIIEVVCGRLGVEAEKVWISQRGRAVKGSVRGMAMYLCQHEADLTLGEIAQRFNLKHDASAGSSLRQFEARLHQELPLQKCLNLIN